MALVWNMDYDSPGISLWDKQGKISGDDRAPPIVSKKMLDYLFDEKEESLEGKIIKGLNELFPDSPGPFCIDHRDIRICMGNCEMTILFMWIFHKDQGPVCIVQIFNTGFWNLTGIITQHKTFVDNFLTYKTLDENLKEVMKNPHLSASAA